MTPLLTDGSFFEAPRWHDGRWWVSDFHRRLVLAVDTAGQPEQVLRTDGIPCGLGWLPDGSLLVVEMDRRRVLRRRPDGSVDVHADLSGHGAGRANELVVDGHGRAWAGYVGFDFDAGSDPAPTQLVRIDPDGTVTVAAEDLLLPNGMAFTAAGTRLVVAESLGARLTSFGVDADGALTDRRVLAQLAATPPLGTFQQTATALRLVPDGCCVDAEDHVWVADALGGPCLRVSPDGDVVDQRPVPAGLAAFACALGGSDGRTLLLCCAPDAVASRREASRDAVLLTTAVDVGARA